MRRVDKEFNDAFILGNSAFVNLDDENLNIVRFVKANSLPAVFESNGDVSCMYIMKRWDNISQKQYKILTTLTIL